MDTQYPSSGVFDVSDYQAFSSKLNILFCVPYVMNVSQYGIASFAGKTLTFTIDGVDTMQTAIWATGGQLCWTWLEIRSSSACQNLAA